jgi:uncharacterized membrane protein
MAAGLIPLLVVIVLFVGGHFLLSSTPLRAQIVARVGERGFAGLFSVVMIVILIATIFAYGRAPYVPVWELGLWAGWVPVLVMPFALMLFVGGYSQPNPTAVMQAAPVGTAEPRRMAPGILAVTRHPIMWGFGLWALSHLVANGDAASIILIGGMAVLALAGTMLIDRKKARSWGPAWPAFAAVTSNLPLLAILEGRNRLSLAEIGWWRILVALAAYAALFALHRYVAGVPIILG